jgi:ribosomal protein S6
MEKEVKNKEKKVKKAKKASNKTDTSKVYEVSFILLPSLSEEAVLKEFESIVKEISSNNGEVISSENPVLVDLAYPMVKVVSVERHKCVKGYFGWIKFEMEAEQVSMLKKFLDLSSVVVRFMIIKTVRENTLLNGKMNFKKEEKIKNTPVVIEDGIVDDASGEELDEELIDKSIEELITE